MPKFSAWSKNNLVIVLATVCTVAALGILAYVVYDGMGFVTRQQQVIQANRNTIKALLDHTVDIPSPDDLNVPIRVPVTVNQAFIDQISQVYRGYEQQFHSLTNLINARNHASHSEMDSDLFPDTSLSEKRFLAQAQMRRGLAAMLVDLSDINTGPSYRLRAGLPPAAEELNRAVHEKEITFLQSRPTRARTLAALSPEELKDLHDEKMRLVLNRLIDRAKSIQIYAQTQAPGSPEYPYPFELPAWLLATSPPQMADIWEGQMQLWAVQDIITAIGLANRAYTLEITPDGNQRIIPSDNPMSVVEAPVKQLLSIKVLPGYVGVPVLSTAPGAAASAAPAESSAAAGLAMPGTASGAPLVHTAVRIDDFAVSPTGRRSFRGVGPLYDVKHVVVSVIVDAKRLPDFFNALGRVNFMTVLKYQIAPVDNYEQLHKGFYYGPDACVKVDLLVETLWFRQWTQPLMPAKVCQELDLLPHTAAAGN
jgi:hypothetical protein